MKILLVDDDEARASQLVAHLIDAGITSDNECIWVDCVDSAKIALRAKYYDVLILDVVLPKRSGESPDPKYGIALLGQISRSPHLNKPEKILGLTAHSSDIDSFRSEFEKHCFTVIDAKSGSDVWRNTVIGALSYTASSKLARAQGDQAIHVITVHGIRTFGHWQSRLKTLVEQRVRGIKFHSYKYGFFSIFAFLFPPFRWFEISYLAKHLDNLFKSQNSDEYVVFSHSFGTLLVAHALRRLIKQGRTLPVRTLVLSASVLPRRFSWAFIQKTHPIRIVNDCGDHDYLLWLCEALILGTGMAGKSGFVGFNGENMHNRFFVGGHSHYFDNDSFMDTYWVPLLISQDPIVDVDQRKSSVVNHEILDKFFAFIGIFKLIFYLFLIFALSLVILYFFPLK